MEGLGSLLMGNIPVLVMMLVGVGLLVFEMYVPGFGVPGVSGILLLGLGFVLLGPTLAQGLLLFYGCRIAAGEPETRDCNAVAWVKPEELRDFDFAGADLEFVKRNYAI